MEQTRRIENYGILKLTAEERQSNSLLILSDVIQLPYSEYLNAKTNPPKGHYGYACFMSREYVLFTVDIQFKRQVIADFDQFTVQLAWQEFCNSKTIASAINVPLPDTTVLYPMWLCDEVRFKLEPGVILNVYAFSTPMTKCLGAGIDQNDDRTEPPGLPPSPSPPPPLDTPEEDKLPLSPPYTGDDDDGNTYVRPDIPPPPITGGGVGKLYKVRLKYTGALGNVEEDDGPFYGPIRGVEVEQNSAGVRGILLASSDAVGTPFSFVRRTNSTPGLEATMTILSITEQP